MKSYFTLILLILGVALSSVKGQEDANAISAADWAAAGMSETKASVGLPAETGSGYYLAYVNTLGELRFMLWSGNTLAFTNNSNSSSWKQDVYRIYAENSGGRKDAYVQSNKATYQWFHYDATNQRYYVNSTKPTTDEDRLLIVLTGNKGYVNGSGNFSDGIAPKGWDTYPMVWYEAYLFYKTSTGKYVHVAVENSKLTRINTSGAFDATRSVRLYAGNGQRVLKLHRNEDPDASAQEAKAADDYTLVNYNVANGTQQAIAPYALTRAGYTFLGWSTDPTATAADPRYSATNWPLSRPQGSSTNRYGYEGVTGNKGDTYATNLYAVWRQDKLWKVEYGYNATVRTIAFATDPTDARYMVAQVVASADVQAGGKVYFKLTSEATDGSNKKWWGFEYSSNHEPEKNGSWSTFYSTNAPNAEITACKNTATYTLRLDVSDENNPKVTVVWPYVISVYNQPDNAENGMWAFTEGEGGKWSLSNFVLPSTIENIEGDNPDRHLWVGKGVYAGHSANWSFGWIPFTRLKNLAVCNRTTGAAAGAMGTLHIDENSTQENYSLTFDPIGYMCMALDEAETNPILGPLTPTAADSTILETALITSLQYDANTYYRVNINKVASPASASQTAAASRSIAELSMSQKLLATDCPQKKNATEYYADNMDLKYKGRAGKYRIDTKSCDPNWGACFVPYIHCQLDPNAPQAEVVQQAWASADLLTGYYYSIESTDAERTIMFPPATPAYTNGCPWVRAGYVFKGWDSDPNGMGRTVLPGEKIVVSEKLIHTETGKNDLQAILYAQWLRQDNVILHRNLTAADATTKVQQTVETRAAILDACSEWANDKPGCAIAGWALTAGGNIVYEAGSQIITMGLDVELYAVWHQTVVVTYHENRGATEKTYRDTCINNTGYDLRRFRDFKADVPSWNHSAEGVDFSHWTADQPGLTTKYQDGDRITLTADLDLYAQWNQNCIITYYPNGADGSKTMAAATVPSGTEYTLTKNAFVWTSYGIYFVGWATSAADAAAGVVTYHQQETIRPTGNVDLYAVWRTAQPGDYILIHCNTSTGGADHQLSLNNSNQSITDTKRGTQTANCFVWKMEDAGNGSQFYLRNYVNSDYYLCCDQSGVLSVCDADSKTAWNSEGSNLCYIDRNMTKHYIVWDLVWKTVTEDVASYKNELIPGYIVHRDFLTSSTPSTTTYNELVRPKSPTSVYTAGNPTGKQTIKFQYTWTTEEYFQGYSEAWNYYYKIVNRTQQPLTGKTTAYTLTKKSETGFDFVDQTASLQNGDKVYTIPLEVTPTAGRPLRVEKQLGVYHDYVDSVICSVSIDTMHLTTRIAMIRRTYYEKDDDRVTLHFRNAGADVQEMHFGYNDVTTQQTGTLSGHHDCQANQYYSYNDQKIASIGAASADHDIVVNLLQDTPTDVFTAHIVDDETGAVATWAEVTKTATTISVRMTEQNSLGRIRTGRLIITHRHSGEVAGQERSLLTSLSVEISQGSRFTDSDGDLLVRNKGIKNIRLDSRGLQQVHSQEQTIYYLPGDVIVLEPRERHLYGWQLWYDYDNLTRIPESMAHFPNDYYCRNTAQLKLIGTGENAQGVYGTQWGVWGTDDAEPMAVAKVTLRIPDDYTGTHRIAGEFSNYHEYGNTFNTQDRKDADGNVIGKYIYEPTLSYRQIWTLRPGSEMAAKMEASKGGEYVESYKFVACAEQGVTLTPEHHIYHYSNPAQLGYVYKDNNGQYHRVGDKDDPDALQPKAYITFRGVKREIDVASITTAHFDEVNDYLIIDGFHSGSIGDQWDGVEELHIIYSIEAGAYNIAEWDVTYIPRAKVGPLTETNGKALITNEEIHNSYLVLSESNFDYNRPLTEKVTYYGQPLSWEESSSGFYYPNSALTPVKSRKTNGYLFRGEYAFMNTTKDVNYRNYSALYENRSGVEDGYFMFVDASSAPGLMAMLNVDQHLCSGQKMYCSAWIGNALGGQRDATFADPSLRFDIRGKNSDEQEWHAVQSFLTGELPKNYRSQNGYYIGDWHQINFEIDLEEDYDQYQIAVYDFAPKGRGNDFVLDDIVIYANELPLDAYQAATSCSTTSVKAVIRMDYEAAKEDMEGYTLYYQVWNKTNNTHVVVEPEYLVADGAERYVACGTVSVPSRGNTPEGAKFASLPAMIQQHDHDVEVHQQWEDADPATRGEEPAITCRGFVKEHIPNSARPELNADRWILYIVHDAPMTSEKNYEVRVAYGHADLDNAQCALTAQLPVTNAYDLVINGETQTSLTPTTCGNDEFELSMNVNTVYIDPATGKQVRLTGQTMNDWLLLENHIGQAGEEDVDPLAEFDITAWRSKAGQDHVQPDGTTGYTFSEIERAVVYNLRQNVEDNPNRFISSLAQIDLAYLNSAEDYQIIHDLVVSGELMLGSATSGIYMHPNDLVRYAVMPVLGSAYDENGNQISMCYTTSFVTLAAPPYTNYKLDIGKVALDDLPEQLRGKPVRMRVNLATANSTFQMNLLTRQQVILPDVMYLVSSNDPEFDPELHWFGYEPDKKYNFGGQTTDYYGTSGVCTLSAISTCPAGKTKYKLKSGYEYTFKIELLSSDGLSTETRGDKDCAIGVSYFTLVVVPDYLRWKPGTNGTNNWQDDANWVPVNALGQVVAGHGYVPLSASNVIVPVCEDGQYPVVSTTPDELNNYDMNYVPASCRAIYFEAGTKLGNQAQLSYEKALADLTLTAQRWYIVSMPLQEIVSGDMSFYTNGSDNAPFAPLSGEVNRTFNTSYISTYSKMYCNYNPEHNKLEADTIVAANTGWSNVLNSLSEPLVPGQAVSMMLWRGDNAAADATIRLPRPDNYYSYYYENGAMSPYGTEISRSAEKVGKFAFNPDNEGSMSITLSNTNPSPYFAFGNPTMAYIDLYKFLQANSHVAGTMYYYEDDQWVPLSTEMAQYGLLSPTEEELFALAPQRGLMIRTADGNAASSLTVNLTSSMLSIYPYSTTVPHLAPARKAVLANGSASSAVLTLTAENDFDGERFSSRVRLGEHSAASNAVVDGEDMMLMSANAGTSEDGYFTTPLNMYVLDEQHALSVDLRERITCLPLLFCYGNDHTPGAVTRLWVHGVNDFDYPLYLCDTLNNTRTLLQDGMYVDIATPAANSLRYYLLGRTADASDDNPGTTTETGTAAASMLDVQMVMTDGRVGVVCNATMLSVSVYDIVGHAVCSISPMAETTTLALPAGVYTIRVQAESGIAVRKIYVK